MDRYIEGRLDVVVVLVPEITASGFIGGLTLDPGKWAIPLLFDMTGVSGQRWEQQVECGVYSVLQIPMHTCLTATRRCKQT